MTDHASIELTMKKRFNWKKLSLLRKASSTIKIQRNPSTTASLQGRRNKAHQLHFLRFGHGWPTSTSSFTAIPIWSRGCWEQTFKFWYIYFWSAEKNFHNVTSEDPKDKQRRKRDNWVPKTRPKKKPKKQNKKNKHNLWRIKRKKMWQHRWLPLRSFPWEQFFVH